MITHIALIIYEKQKILKFSFFFMEQLELASLVGQWKEAVEGSQLSADALEPFLPIFARMQQVCKTLLVAFCLLIVLPRPPRIQIPIQISIYIPS